MESLSSQVIIQTSFTNVVHVPTQHSIIVIFVLIYKSILHSVYILLIPGLFAQMMDGTENSNHEEMECIVLR